jgi:hypothetical protein
MNGHHHNTMVIAINDPAHFSVTATFQNIQELTYYFPFSPLATVRRADAKAAVS